MSITGFLRGDDLGACASSVASSVTKGELVSSSHVISSSLLGRPDILVSVEPGARGEAGLLQLRADWVSGESIIVGGTTASRILGFWEGLEERTLYVLPEPRVR
jgi:hypothetical protein